jgi:hypothetical protein
MESRRLDNDHGSFSHQGNDKSVEAYVRQTKHRPINSLRSNESRADEVENSGKSNKLLSTESKLNKEVKLRNVTFTKTFLATGNADVVAKAPAYIACAEGHVTHAFLACDVHARCGQEDENAAHCIVGLVQSHSGSEPITVQKESDGRRIRNRVRDGGQREDGNYYVKGNRRIEEDTAKV